MHVIVLNYLTFYELKRGKHLYSRVCCPCLPVRYACLYIYFILCILTNSICQHVDLMLHVRVNGASTFGGIHTYIHCKSILTMTWLNCYWNFQRVIDFTSTWSLKWLIGLPYINLHSVMIL